MVPVTSMGAARQCCVDERMCGPAVRDENADPEVIDHDGNLSSGQRKGCGHQATGLFSLQSGLTARCTFAPKLALAVSSAGQRLTSASDAEVARGRIAM